MSKNNREAGGQEQQEQEISLEEGAFRAVVKDRLIGLYCQELDDAGADETAIAEFEALLRGLDNWREFSSIVSWPYAIRQKFIKQLAKLSGREIIEALRDRLALFDQYQRPRPKIGFHTTGEEIKPKKNKNGELAWDIAGREISDLAGGKLAFAADNFAGLYHNKESDKFYVVRIMDDEGKYDYGQGWHQAPNFSIVAGFETEEIYRAVDRTLEGAEEKELAAA